MNIPDQIKKAQNDTFWRAGFHAAWGAALAVGLVIMGGAAVSFLITALFVSRDSTDYAGGPRSGLTLRTDAMTGCQYLETRDGGITPRLLADGTQFCGARPGKLLD